MEQSELSASNQATLLAGDAGLPFGWIGARDLPTLTLHLRGMAGDAQMSVGELAEALFAIDDESRALLSVDRGRFFAIATSGTGRGDAVWTIVRTFLDELFLALSDLVLRDAYAGSEGELSRSGRAELMARTLRAGAGGVCWDAFRYGPHDEAGWARLGHVFSLAVEAGLADQALVLLDVPQTSLHVTPKRAFLHGVAVRCAGFDRLPVELMDDVERWIGQAVPSMALQHGECAGALYSLRLGEGVGPRRRLSPDSAEPDLWYFAPGAAFSDALVPPSPAGAHLRYQWSRQQPIRRHPRYGVAGPLGVVHRWEDVLAALSGKPGAPRQVGELANVSRGGVNVRVPVDGAAGARVGDLMGLWVEGGGDCQLGVVRRIERSSAHSINLGVEIISKAPTVLEFDDGRAAALGVACDPVRPGATVRFLARPDAVNEGGAVFLKSGASVLKLRPLGGVIRARSCQLQTFRVM